MSNTKIFGANHGIVTSNVIPDNNSTALDIESTDAKDYIAIDTTDGSETLTLKAGGSSSQEMVIDANGNVSGPSGSHYKLFARGATATQPTVVPYASRTTTGLGSAADDQLSLIAGGAEGIRVVKDASSSQIMVGINGAPEDQDNAVLQLTGNGEEAELIIRRNTKDASNDEVAFLGYRAQSAFSIDAEGGIQFRNQGGGKRAEFDSSGNFTTLHTTTVQDSDLQVQANSADAVSKSLIFKKSRNATDGSAATIVQDNDVLGEIEFKGANGAGAADANFSSGAKIFARVNGTPGDDNMPTEIVFCTSADGSETPSENVHIFSNGHLGVGDTSNTSKVIAATGDVRFSANVLGNIFAWVSNSSYKIAPGATDSASKLNGPLAFEVTSDPTGIADCAEIYAKDVDPGGGGAIIAELFARDEGGNVTQLSPHNFQLFEPDASYTQPWSYTSKNAYIGKEIGVDMFGLVKAVEELSGKKLIYERDLPDEEVKDWYVEQGKIQAARETEIAEWDASKEAEDGGISDERPRPEPYVIKDPPDWLKSRLKLGGG